MGGNKSVYIYVYVYARDRRGRVKRDRDIRGEKKREREREEGQKEEADMRRMREREACTRTRLVCGGNISTEINQGCTQISKRKITKINRPDVQCDKKALPSSFSPFSLFSLSLSFFVSSRYPSLAILFSFPSPPPPPPRQGPRGDSSVHGHETADCTTELSWGLYQLHRSYP